MQVPSNLIMNTIPYPRLFMGGVATLWGAISALTAVSRLVLSPVWECGVESAYTATYSFVTPSSTWSCAGFSWDSSVSTIYAIARFRSAGSTKCARHTHRGGVLSFCGVLSFSMVYEERDWSSYRFVRVSSSVLVLSGSQFT